MEDAGLKIIYEAVSNVGCRRSNNEDMALVGRTVVRDDMACGDVVVGGDGRFAAIVSDGMGGYGGGEIASEMVVRSFDRFLVNLAPGLDDAALRGAMKRWLDALEAAVEQGQRKPGLKGMGATLTGVFFYDGRVYMVNAGDSRVYRWRGGELRLMTVDHSERVRLNNPMIPSNLIYNAIGVPGVFITLALLDERDPVAGGDIYIVCSDGLNDMIGDSEIAAIISARGGAGDLVDAALAAGGDDNCTVIVMSVDDMSHANESPGIPGGDEI